MATGCPGGPVEAVRLLPGLPARGAGPVWGVPRRVRCAPPGRSGCPGRRWPFPGSAGRKRELLDDQGVFRAQEQGGFAVSQGADHGGHTFAQDLGPMAPQAGQGQFHGRLGRAQDQRDGLVRGADFTLSLSHTSPLIGMEGGGKGASRSSSFLDARQGCG